MATVTFAPHLTRRISLAESTPPFPRDWAPPAFQAMRNPLASTDKLPCTSLGTSADGVPRQSDVFTMGVIIQRFLTASNGSKLCAKTIRRSTCFSLS